MSHDDIMETQVTESANTFLDAPRENDNDIELSSAEPSPLNIDIDIESYKEELGEDPDVIEIDDLTSYKVTADALEARGGTEVSEEEVEMSSNELDDNAHEEEYEIHLTIDSENDSVRSDDEVVVSRLILVKELDSEDEIENLEEDTTIYTEINSNSGESDDSYLESDVTETNDNNGHHSELDDEEIGAPDEKQELEAQVLPDHEPREEIIDVATKQDNESNSVTSYWSEVPVFIDISGDEYLLIPFFEPCQYQLQDMISLFSLDEISDCAFNDFFELLRGNGDLIDAYNFNVEDELKINIPELRLCLTEDSVYSKTLRLDDLLGSFCTLRRCSKKNGDTRTPDKLTIFVSMQQRFITKYNRLNQIAKEGGTFSDVYRSFVDSEKIDSDGDSDRKKRKLDEV